MSFKRALERVTQRPRRWAWRHLHQPLLELLLVAVTRRRISRSHSR